MQNIAGDTPLIFDEYAKIAEFAENHKGLTYLEFDHYTKKQVNLFAIRENFDFAALETALDKISAALPAIKRIFAKPIIRLKDSDAVLSVESVRVINSKTVTHTAVHSELWENVKDGELKPRALMTLQNIDNYVIYENVVFARAVDATCAFLSKNIRLMREMLYACHDMKFNLLEKDDHMEYFLAIGKLHMAYMRDYDKYVVPASRCLSRLLFIESTIKARLGSQVYRKCCKKGGKITLKKTNIFRSHKDYNKIYKLMKWYSEQGIPKDRDDPLKSFIQSKPYTLYCSMITLFGAGHFGFEFDHRHKIDFETLKVSAQSGSWKLAIIKESEHNTEAIRITLLKDRPYSVLIVPTLDQGRAEEALALAKELFDANEYVIAGPECFGNGELYLSVFDIQSFRKIQQILLRAMIYSDEKRDVCPFCGEPLFSSHGLESAFECRSCRTLIKEKICQATKEKYFESSIKNHKNDQTISKDKQIAERQIVGSMHFRNITSLNEKGELVCPKCKKVHITRSNA